MNAIENADGNGVYSVSWSASDYADSYTLEEDDNVSFSSPTDAYIHSGLTKAVSGKDIGTYYYRVKATNTYRESDWSNTELVVVTVPLPDCPQTGSWSGTTDQGGNIHFQVENSPQCQIVARISFRLKER